MRAFIVTPVHFRSHDKMVAVVACAIKREL